MQGISEQHIFVFLVQVFLLLILAKGLADVFTRWKQPAFTAEMLVGLLLGPSILGRFLPDLYRIIFPDDVIQRAMLETVAWVGLFFFLLNTGLEVDFSSAWRQRGDAMTIAITDIIVPMTVSFAACLWLPDRYLVDPSQRSIFALFMATAMTISAMPITARALHDLRISKTDLGFLIVSALSVNDIIGWLIFTVTLGLFTQAGVDALKLAGLLGLTVGFTVFCLSVGRGLVDFIFSKIKARQTSPAAAPLTLLWLLGLLCAAVTQKLGVHALFGFFLAGIMAGEAKAISERTRQTISQMVYAIFVPLFFASIGLKVDFLRNFDPFIVAFVTLISVAGKFGGAWLGVNFTKLARSNRLPVAIAHVPGGSMEIVIGLIAYQYHLIAEPVFVAVVFSAVASAMVVGPWLSYALETRRRVSILEYFSRRGILPEIKEPARDEALRQLCERAATLDENPDAEIFYQPVLERENAMGTAMEEGIAVPHARVPSLKMPLIVFGRSPAGIEWDSPDGKPAQFIFLVLTPAHRDELQVQVLSSIARTLGVAETRRRLLEAPDADRLWGALRGAFGSSEIVRK
ncbi:MAG: cation:proton antiporter [Candidatus Omnitrophica bacterium]|nr:cation:proton antiporter [Candidatus Omnitrophota bacterium]